MWAVRIIVVEDDPALGTIIKRGLVEDGYAVDLATGVMKARELTSVHSYDLMVLDLGLPDGDGVELARALRHEGAQHPILVLTARDGLSDKVAGLDAGADDYLTKPFDFPEFAARIRALLRRPAATQPTELVAGDIRLDRAAHAVWRGAIAVSLTAREFSLLEVLLARKGEVVSRSVLLEHVWDAHYDGLSNVVDVHIANLRRKLDLPGDPAPIDTVRGVGYTIPA